MGRNQVLYPAFLAYIYEPYKEKILITHWLKFPQKCRIYPLYSVSAKLKCIAYIFYCIFRPSFWCRTSSETTCTAVETKRSAAAHDENEICDDEEECSLPKKRVRKVSNLISNTASTQMSLARRILFHSRLGPQNQKVPQSEDNKNVCSSSLDPNTTSSSSQRQTTTMVSTCTTSSINHESKPIIQVVAVDINHGMQC